MPLKNTHKTTRTYLNGSVIFFRNRFIFRNYVEYTCILLNTSNSRVLYFNDNLSLSSQPVPKL